MILEAPTAFNISSEGDEARITGTGYSRKT
jgi:hypothetical protein